MSTYTQTTCTHDPEDFHQLAINRGQRKINYKLTVTDKRLIEAIKALIGALAKLPNPPQNEITAASMAVKEAEDINKVVAEIRPPGCDET
jgi:hypothetical protein